MLKRLKLTGIAATAAILMSAPAMAATVIDFRTGDANVGGLISWDGTNLIGSNIPIGRVTIADSPMGAGVYNVIGVAQDVSGVFFAGMNFNTAPANNFINIIGCIPGLFVGTVDANGNCTSPVTLLEGRITNFNNSLSPQGLQGAFGVDTKNALLLAALGLPANTPFELFGGSIVTSNLQPNGLPNSVISTDIRNTAVPEPATMVLLGTGLLAAFRARRRTA